MENENNPAPAATPTPATPPVAPGAEPTSPAAPTTPPVQPSAPTAPETPAAPPVQPTPEEAAAKAEDDEWDAAADELFPGVKSTKKGGKNEPTQPKKDGEATPKAPGDSKDEKQEPKPGAGDDASKPGEGAEKDGDKSDESGADAAIRNARAVARQSEQQLTAMKTDVRAKLFPKVPAELMDADGDPIRTVEDVMRLKDPSTGEQFEREAAQAWFDRAQRDFRDAIARVDEQVVAVAEVNLMLKDEADYVNETYGEILKADEDLRNRIWAQYDATTVKDPETGIIVKAPVSLKAFYDIALKPYADAAKKAKEDAAAAAPATPPPAAPAAPGQSQTPPAATRDQKRSDRSDIYAPNNNPKGDPEDEEWADAAREVFGDQLKK